MNRQPLIAGWVSCVGLTKPLITLSVAFSALMGFLLFSGSFTRTAIFFTLGLMLLAAGSSALNQIQEVHTDSLMLRTRQRPLPSGQISSLQALLFTSFLLTAGTILMLATAPLAGALLAWITLLWYNLLYTPLKPRTMFAIIPGAVVGALPPLAGWVAAGGQLLHPVIIMVCFFFFVGQIPHFWLIQLKHSSDYQKAGFPALTATFSPRQISRLTLAWIAATLAGAAFLPFFGIIRSPWLGTLVYLMIAMLVVVFRPWFRQQVPENTRPAFIGVNMFYLMMILILMADSLGGKIS